MDRKRYVYAGVRESGKGKRVQLWYPLEGIEEGESAEDITNGVCFKCLEKYTWVGDIYSYEIEEKDGKRYFGKGERAGKWENEGDLILWRAKEVATNAEFAARKKSKQDPLLEILDPIRQAYFRLSGIQRAQFLAKIITTITTYKGK